MESGRKTKFRIISDTTTFYPVEVSDEESQHRNDNMTLLTTITYLREQLNEEFQFFKAGDLFIVLQNWRGMLFFVETKENYSAELLRFMLQTTREILIFLFGTRFENVMRRNISLAKRQVFSRYVEAFLNVLEIDYHFLRNTLVYSDRANEIQAFFNEKPIPTPKDIPVKLLSVMLFDGYKLCVNFKNPKAPKLEPETISLLQLFIRVEFPDIDTESEYSTQESHTFDPEYVATGAGAKHKGAFLRLDRAPTGCTLSCTRCGPASHYIAVVVTQNTKMPIEVQTQLNGYMSEITAFLSQLVLPPVPAPQRLAFDDLVHFIAIDRTGGFVWELPTEYSVGFISESDRVDYSVAAAQLDRACRRASSYAASALMRGFTTMMWGELDFQYCYEARFLVDDEETKPKRVFTPPSFDDDNGVSYSLIAQSVFPGEDDVRILELVSIYRGSVRPKEAMATNAILFQQFREYLK